MTQFYLRKIISGCIFGTCAALGFFGASSLATPLSSGESGVPVVGYIYDILSNKILVNGSLSTTDGKVKNAEAIDAIPAASFQGRVTGSCPIGEWAYGVNSNKTIKCRSN